MAREFFEVGDNIFPLDAIEYLAKYRRPEDGQFAYELHLCYKNSGMKYTIMMSEEKGEQLKQLLLKEK